MTGSPAIPAIGRPAGTAVGSAGIRAGVNDSAHSGDRAVAAHKFEAMAIAQFLKPIFATMGKADAPFGGGSVSHEFQPFLIDAIAKSMEARGGIGLAPTIEAAIERQPATRTSQKSGASR